MNREFAAKCYERREACMAKARQNPEMAWLWVASARAWNWLLIRYSRERTPSR